MTESSAARLGGLERRVMDQLWADSTGDRCLYRATSSRAAVTAELMRETLDGAAGWSDQGGRMVGYQPAP